MTGPGVLGTYAYDRLGRRTTATRGNGTVTTYGWDGGSRLISLTNNLSGTTQDATWTLGYNPAGQVVSRALSNSLYAYTGQPTLDDDYTLNGLNQVTAVDSTSVLYDGRGNITGDGQSEWNYDASNRITRGDYTGIDIGTYSYDPASRLSRITASGVNSRFLYAGAQAVGEYDSSGALIRRYVPGAGLDDYAAHTTGTGGSISRDWPVVDPLGSVVGITNGSATATTINTYDEYGVPGTFSGRFGYAGSMHLNRAMAAPWLMRNRQYNPTLGRFMQTDPIGIAGGVNLYGYVGNDPVNAVDPWGLQEDCGVPGRPVCKLPEIVVTARRCETVLCIVDPFELDRFMERFMWGNLSARYEEWANDVCPTARNAAQRFGPGNYRLSANVNAVPGVGMTYDVGSSFTIAPNGSITGVFSERATASYGLDVTAGVQLEDSHGDGATFYVPSVRRGGLDFRPSLRLGPGVGVAVNGSGRVTGETLAYGVGASVARADTERQISTHGAFSLCQ